jgi:hypothetical protein
MRSFLMWMPLVVLVTSLNGQSEVPDPYWISLISFELKVNSEGRRVVSSWSQKRLVQLGDRVAVSILKILEPAELTNPQKVKSYLPIVRTAFTEPVCISLETDKDPKVTVFLLNYLGKNVSDPVVQEEIHRTLEFVKEQTAK